MTTSNDMNSAKEKTKSQTILDENIGNYPTAEWQKFGIHQWGNSDLSDHLYQSMIDIGDGIELCVEAGGNPNNPPLLMIMGLGSQMIFGQTTSSNVSLMQVFL